MKLPGRELVSFGALLALLLISTGWPGPHHLPISPLSLFGKRTPLQGKILQGVDVLAHPGEEVDLEVSYEHFDGPALQRPLAGKKIYFFLDKERIGIEMTSESGRAICRYRAPEPGDYQIRISTSRREDRTVDSSYFLLKVVHRRDPLVLCDIEMTLHAFSSVRFPFVGNEEVFPAEGAATALTHLARYRTVVYLSSGTSASAQKARGWLDNHNFPVGPILFWALPGRNEQAEKEKAERIAALKDRFPNIYIGIGNRKADAEACVNNQIPFRWIGSPKEDDIPPGARVYSGWNDLLLALEEKQPPR